MSKAQKIPLISAILMTINITVGGGILIGPAQMAAVAGNWSFVGWIIAALVNLPLVLSITRMSEVLPAEGGFASFCEVGLGKFMGHLGGWLYFVGYSCAAATILLAYKSTLAGIFPDIFLIKNSVLFFTIFVTTLIGLNNLPISTIAKFQSTLTIIKLTPIAVGILLLPFFIKTDMAYSSAELVKIPWSLPFAIFGFMGFEFAASLVNDIEGGAAQARKAIVGGFFAVTAIYIAFHYSLLNIMGAENLAQFRVEGFPQFVGQKFALLGKLLILTIPTATIITYFNSSNGLFTLGSSVLESMGKSGNIYYGKTISSTTNANRPFYAILTFGALVFTLGTIIGDLNILGSVTNLMITSVFMLANISLFLADKKGSIFNRAINLTALPLTFGMLIYHFMSSGPTMAARLISISPLLGFVVIGILLYKPLFESSKTQTVAVKKAVPVEKTSTVTNMLPSKKAIPIKKATPAEKKLPTKKATPTKKVVPAKKKK